MATNTAVTTSEKRPARHFDRGFRSALRRSLPTVALLAACSGSLNPSNPQGTAGSAGSAGDAGATGSECGARSGAGNCVATGGTGSGGTAGIGGTGGGGATGIGGSGGSVPLPACAVNGPMFGVCFVNDTETSASNVDMQTSGAATIEAVGSGAAPVQCPSGRAIGVSSPNHWWFQARAADNRLWTIAALGLGGSTPPVRKDDVVTLDLDWDVASPVPGATYTNGILQVSDAAGTPILWAGSSQFRGASIPSAPTWISFTAGDPVCGSAEGCDLRQSNVIASVNGSSATLPPYGAASIGGYFLQVTYFPHLCGDWAPPFHAAAAKASPTTSP